MPARSEKEKMLAGSLYLASDPELVQARRRARRLLRVFNQTSEDEIEKRAEILGELLGKAGERVWIEPPFYCDYGVNIYMEEGVYLNFNCVILDCNTVRIGRGTEIGPAVQIYTAYHPTNPLERATNRETAAPVKIGENVWIGGGAIVLQGVTIGDNTTIGAGSVVVRDVPANVVAVGNPCKVIRDLG